MGEEAFSKPLLKLHSEVSGRVQFTLNCHSAEIWQSNDKISTDWFDGLFCVCEVLYTRDARETRNEDNMPFTVLEIGQKFRLASYQWMHLMCFTYFLAYLQNTPYMNYLLCNLVRSAQKE